MTTDKMLISKDSWHYRLLTWWSMPIPESLCSYFWKVIFTIAVTGICGIPVLIAMLYMKIDKKITNKKYFYLLVGVSVMTFFSCLLVLIGMSNIPSLFVLYNCFIFVATAIILLSIYFDNFPRQKKQKQKEKIEKPSLIKEFIKAKKNKYCPRLEFK